MSYRIKQKIKNVHLIRSLRIPCQLKFLEFVALRQASFESRQSRSATRSRAGDFDSWGELGFKEKDFAAGQKGWNGSFRGKKMDAGVFGFWAEVELFDGSVEKRTGYFLLVR